MRFLQSYVHLSRTGIFAHLLVGLSVSITSSWAQAGPMDVVNQIDVDTFRHYFDDLMYAHDGDDRSPYGPQHDPARDNIEATLRSFGLLTYLDEFEYWGEPWYNVVAIKPGLVTPGRQYIISGHFDGRDGPAADDDASACAAVLEIARVLSRYPFESTLIFIAFDLEELYLIGSQDYVNRHRDDDIRGMVSMDLIAYNSGTETCTIYGRAASNEIKSALADAVETYSNGLTATVLGPLDRSDHAPFEWVGKQACWLIETDGLESNPCYHRPCDSVDTPGYIDYDYAIQLIRSLTGYLVEQAGLMDIPGDYNGDSRVDLVDFEAFLTCFTGPDDGPYFPACETFDLDSDDDIDFGDFGALQLVFTGE